MNALYHVQLKNARISLALFLDEFRFFFFSYLIILNFSFSFTHVSHDSIPIHISRVACARSEQTNTHDHVTLIVTDFGTLSYTIGRVAST